MHLLRRIIQILNFLKNHNQGKIHLWAHLLSNRLCMKRKVTHPEWSSDTRKSAAARLDLPAPVRPTIPSFSPPLHAKVIPRNARGKPGLQKTRNLEMNRFTCRMIYSTFTDSASPHFQRPVVHVAANRSRDDLPQQYSPPLPPFHYSISQALLESNETSRIRLKTDLAPCGAQWQNQFRHILNYKRYEDLVDNLSLFHINT